MVEDTRGPLRVIHNSVENNFSESDFISYDGESDGYELGGGSVEAPGLPEFCEDACNDELVKEATSIRASENYCMDLDINSLVNKKCDAMHNAFIHNQVTGSLSNVPKVIDKEDEDKLCEEVVANDGEGTNPMGSAEGPTVDTFNAVDKT